MRTLVIAGEYPWPEDSGSRIRLATTLRGLMRCGPTDLFSIIPDRRTDIAPPDQTLGLDRVGRVGIEDRPVSGWSSLPAALRAATPLALPQRDGPTATRALTRFMHGHYDLVWYFGIRAWALAGGLESVPTVLDLDDLEDQKIAARLATVRPTGRTRRRARHRAGRLISEEEARRWRRLQRRAAERTTVTVVCSSLDADRARRSGVARVEVVPNGYRRITHPVGRVETGSPPTLLFQGTLRYPPNADAAHFLVGEVLPELNELLPGVRTRLVGVSTPAVVALDDPPAVTVVGRVPDIAVELAGADLVVVPLRFGSGTRVKIIEAFAQRVPVVSTTLGAEGLDAVDGEHLLIGDTPVALATACARLLGDPVLRSRITEAAHRLFLDRFETGRVEQTIAALARSLVGPGPGPSAATGSSPLDG